MSRGVQTQPALSFSCVTLLSLSNIGVSFGATELFKNVTFTVGEGERWGIIGRNGAGKTSIFKLITGELQPTVGSVARKPGLRHALLDQHRAFEGATTVWDAGAAAWREVIALEKRIAELAIELGELGERVTDEFLERFGQAQERFADLGGYVYHARVDAVLQGLGFDAEESKTRLVSSLSGGERGRVGLAAQLIAPADLLLLDEPTNHESLKRSRRATRLSPRSRQLEAARSSITHTRTNSSRSTSDFTARSSSSIPPATIRCTSESSFLVAMAPGGAPAGSTADSSRTQCVSRLARPIESA